MNSVFIDSNIIIKYFAGDAQARSILKPVVYGEVLGFINNIVLSEVLFIIIKLLNRPKSVRASKEAGNNSESTRDHKR
jgi:predicted nucleic acid-binding protein